MGKTMLVVTYGDAGGFFDQVIPPYEGVPADDAPCHKHFSHPNPKCLTSGGWVGGWPRF